jgi:hypothetical protein
MNGGPHKEINDIRAIVHSGGLSKCTEAQLKRILEVIDHYDAGLQFEMTQGLRKPVQAQLELVQRERYHNESKLERGTLQQEVMREVKGMFTASASDADKKHAETARTAKTANIIAGTALVVSIVAVFVAHRDNTRSSIVGTNATPIKTLQPLPETPQIVLPTPAPTPTNLTGTNSPSKE